MGVGVVLIPESDLGSLVWVRSPLPVVRKTGSRVVDPAQRREMREMKKGRTCRGPPRVERDEETGKEEVVRGRREKGATPRALAAVEIAAEEARDMVVAGYRIDICTGDCFTPNTR
jgi:hypothetical protein